ncbi:XdhC family protein [Actinotalea sp.]|uniref:XdhC family protein n=1 Tax=Actinotalea sp. TaxID=1872145 RepID=UPI0035621585
MHEILAALTTSGPHALVTVTRTMRSSPLPVGTSMVVGADGSVVGNVSAGCVDGDAVLRAEEVLRTGLAETAHYGVTNETAMGVGLACGGELDLVISVGPSSELVRFVLGHAESSPGAALVTVVEPEVLRGRHLAVGPDQVRGTTGIPELDAELGTRARELTADGRSGVVVIEPRGGVPTVSAVVRVAVPAPRMLVFGAGANTAPLTQVGKILGYHVTVCDARGTFATAERNPEADELVVAWPHRYLAGTTIDSRTVICSLSHDPKFEIPLLVEALRGPAAYVGALGSRRTTRARVERLLEEGLTQEEIARLHAPIGLDLGGATPQETAISIAAEIVASRSGRSGLSGGSAPELRSSVGSIHGWADS